MESSENEYIKAIEVIRSCKTEDQIHYAKRYVNLLKRKWVFESRFIQNSKNSSALNNLIADKIVELNND